MFKTLSMMNSVIYGVKIIPLESWKAALLMFSFFLIVSSVRILRLFRILFVRRKTGVREKHWGKYCKRPNKLGKYWVKHEEMYGKMGGGTCLELPLREFLSYLVTNFQAVSYLARITRKYLWNLLV